MNQNQSDMAKKSAISGEYIIQVEDNGSVVELANLVANSWMS